VLAAAAKPAPTIDLVHPLIHGFFQVWPVWLILAGLGAARLAVEIYKARRLRRAGILDIDQMNGTTFELRLAALFRGLGYRAEVVGSARGDYGADLIVTKDGNRAVVQAKCWSKNVGVKAVQEVVGARGYYGADSALVVTNRQFTVQARELAKRNDVTLWGRDVLIASLLKAQKDTPVTRPASTPLVSTGEPTQMVLSPATAHEQVPGSLPTPTSDEGFCAQCWVPVSAKVRDYCRGHSERFEGAIYCYEHQRDFRHSARAVSGAEGAR
jgi:restriction system protein